MPADVREPHVVSAFCQCATPSLSLVTHRPRIGDIGIKKQDRLNFIRFYGIFSTGLTGLTSSRQVLPAVISRP
ncbi:hypothetical protein BCAR13_910010 [Paraburkholderia caribensis]|nr:hypothetical protein BCAR13_910010 [Paraburkholderia caribensis]